MAERSIRVNYDEDLDYLTSRRLLIDFSKCNEDSLRKKDLN